MSSSLSLSHAAAQSSRQIHSSTMVDSIQPSRRGQVSSSSTHSSGSSGSKGLLSKIRPHRLLTARSFHRSKSMQPEAPSKSDHTPMTPKVTRTPGRLLKATSSLRNLGSLHEKGASSDHSQARRSFGQTRLLQRSFLRRAGSSKQLSHPTLDSANSLSQSGGQKHHPKVCVPHWISSCGEKHLQDIIVNTPYAIYPTCAHSFLIFSIC